MNIFSKKTMIFRTMLLERVDSFKWMFCQRMFSQWWFSGDQSWSSCNLCQVWRFSETGRGLRKITIRLRSAFLLQLPRTAAETGPLGGTSPFQARSIGISSDRKRQRAIGLLAGTRRL